MGCCGTDGELKTYEESRSCTDFPCTLVFIIFWIGFIVIAAIGFANGDPDKLLYGTDYLGYVCGRGDGPGNFAAQIPDGAPFQSKNWGNNSNIWYPIPANFTALLLDPTTILDTGVCVHVCPTIPSSTEELFSGASFNFKDLLTDSNNINVFNSVSVYTYGNNNSATGSFVYAPEKHLALYNSEPFYRRCLPFGNSSDAIKSAVSSIPGGSATTDFFFRGFLEVQASWLVILLCGLFALVLCFIYIFIMRCLVRVITYLCLFLVGVLLLAMAGFCYYQFDKMKEANNSDPKDSDMEKYENAWFAGIFVFIVLFLLYVVLIFFLWKYIQEAIGLLEIASKVVAASPFQLLVPPVVAVLVIGTGFWCAFVGVWIYTSDTFKDGPTSLQALPFDFNASSLPFGINADDLIKQGNETLLNVTTGALENENARTFMLFYDLFGFLWTMGFFNAMGFMVLSFHSVFWYYSSVKDEDKEIPSGSMCRAVCWSVIHSGTLAVGSFLIALVQFVRIVMNYVAKKCKAIDSTYSKFILAVANCCLACFERIVKIISKNAYIMCAITSQWFLCAAKRAVEILLENFVTASIVLVLSEIVCFVGKALIVLLSMLLAFFLLDVDALIFFDVTIETKILPIIVVGLVAYFVCVIFFNIYSTAVDSLFICFHQDLKMNAGVGMYYAPKELADTIENYDKEKAEAKFEQMQEAEAQGAEPQGK